jgi:hypothetical protein
LRQSGPTGGYGAFFHRYEVDVVSGCPGARSRDPAFRPPDRVAALDQVSRHYGLDLHRTCRNQLRLAYQVAKG